MFFFLQLSHGHPSMKKRPVRVIRLPAFAPFGTEGFTLSPEEQRKRENREDRENRDDRRKKGVDKDF